MESTPGGDRGLKERNWCGSKKGSFQVPFWWQVRGEETKRDDWLLRFQSGWLGCKKRGRAGGEADLAAPSPSPACLDKTPGTCGGISMRHHTWRKRQLNPSPPVQWAPAPTSLASIWNGYVGMQLTSQPLRGCFSLWVRLKHALWKIAVKIKQEPNKDLCLKINTSRKIVFTFCTLSSLLGKMILFCCWNNTFLLKMLGFFSPQYVSIWLILALTSVQQPTVLSSVWLQCLNLGFSFSYSKYSLNILEKLLIFWRENVGGWAYLFLPMCVINTAYFFNKTCRKYLVDVCIQLVIFWVQTNSIWTQEPTDLRKCIMAIILSILQLSCYILV